MSQRVLIVEDDPLIGADLVATLKGFGYEPLGPLTRGEEVVARFRELKPDFVLMDIALAGTLDGIQTAERIQSDLNAPIVFLSGLTDEATLQRVKLVRPFGYLIKPFDSFELRSTIEVTLQRFAEIPRDFGDSAPHTNILDLELNTSSASDEIVEFLAQLPLFDRAPKLPLQSLAQCANVREFDALEYVVSEGETPNIVFVPVSGRLSVTKTSESGKELIVALLGVGDPFGFFFSLAGYAGTSSTRAQIPSRVIVIPMRDWTQFVANAPLVSQNLCNSLAQRLSNAHTISSGLAHARVEGRIVNALVALLADFGRPTRGGPDEGKIFITRKELAELTGTTPETAIRVTKSLEREGLLDLTKPGIIKIPDVTKLKALISE